MNIYRETFKRESIALVWCLPFAGIGAVAMIRLARIARSTEGLGVTVAFYAAVVVFLMSTLRGAKALTLIPFLLARAYEEEHKYRSSAVIDGSDQATGDNGDRDAGAQHDN